MANMAVQLLAFFLGLLGLSGTVVAILLPQWQCTGYTGSSIISAIFYMKGLWMECVWSSAGMYQCQIHRSMLGLPQNLQAARALMMLSVLVSLLGVALGAAGMECTRCVGRPSVKGALAVAGGVCFAGAGLLCLAAVSWTTVDVIRQLADPALPHGVRYEVGQAVYLGFVSVGLSISGGALLCLSSSGTQNGVPYLPQAPQSYQNVTAYKANNTSTHTSVSSSDYRLSDYV